MADEILHWDKDGGRAAGAITNDTNKFLRNLRVDPITGRLLVDAAVSITDDTEHAEDSAFTNGDNGKLVLGVRQDADTSPVSTDGDYHAMIFDNAGNQKVNVKISALPAGAATSAKQDTGNTSLASIDGKITATGAAVPASAFYSGMISAGGNLQGLTAANNIGDGGSLTAGLAVGDYNFDGSNWNRVRSISNATNSTGTGLTAAGILAQFDDVSPTSITENQFGNLRMSANRNLYGTIRDAAGNERGLNISSRNAALVEGGTASGSAIAAAPLTIGGRAASANPTAVTDGQVVNTLHDLKGRIIANLGQFRDLRSKQTTTISASTSETTIGTAVASTFLDLVALVISNTSAAAARVDIRDTTAGTVLFSLYIPAGDVRGFVLPGVSIPQTTINTNWTAQSSASVTDLRILAIFEKNT